MINKMKNINTIPPMLLMNQETVKDFTNNPAETKSLCEEFGFSEDDNIYTKELMMILADESDEINAIIKAMNQEENEIEI